MGDQRLLLLFAAEHFVNVVRLLSLMPEDIVGMMDFLVEAAGGVAVENRAAQRDVGFAVAVGANRHVPAGHDILELVGARLAEDGEALAYAQGLPSVSSLSCLKRR